jgi:hypothetical protein
MKFQTIGARITVLCTTLVGFAVALGLLAVNRISEIREDMVVVTTDSLPGIYTAGRIDALTKRARVIILTHVAQTSREAKDSLEQDLARTQADVRSAMDDYRRTIMTERDREVFGRVAPRLDAWLQVWPKIRSLSRDMNTPEALRVVAQECTPAFSRLEQVIDELREFNRKNAESTAEERTEMGRDPPRGGRHPWHPHRLFPRSLRESHSPKSRRPDCERRGAARKRGGTGCLVQSVSVAVGIGTSGGHGRNVRCR